MTMHLPSPDREPSISSNSSDANGSSSADEDSVASLASRENKAVKWLRFLFFCILILAAFLVGFIVYYSQRVSRSAKWRQLNMHGSPRGTQANEGRSFHSTFAASADKLTKSFDEGMERRIEAIDAVSVGITTIALATNQTFPFVLVDNFEFFTMSSRILAQTTGINFCILVTDEKREEWEAYVERERGNFWEQVAIGTAQRARQDSLNGDQQRQLQAGTFFPRSDRIWDSTLQAESETDYHAPGDSGPYLPIWQVAPAVPFPVTMNYNLLSHAGAEPGLRVLMKDKEAVIDVASNLNDENLGQSGAFAKITLENSQFRDDVDTYLGDPISSFVYPVFDDLVPESRSLAGALATNIYWRLSFMNILPETTIGVICVVSNSFNQTMTFRVDGSSASYLGAFDVHNPKYDSISVENNLNDYMKKQSSIAHRSYTAVELSDFGRYTIRIYPTQDMEDTFRTMRPILSFLVVACIFLSTSLFFVAYDWWVSRRQDVVMERAVESSAIVSSLFPSQVRNQIYEESRKPKKSSGEHEGQTSIEMFLVSDSGTFVQSHVPIAQIYDNTTIMFADIAGFTKWCSKRQPAQVFELLETLYGAFDRISEKRRVFKVETIGDCYVAVTGLPHRQPHHASIMVRFAAECMAKMKTLLGDLVDRLGEDTTCLEMRVGLHSGSVTGGVLRGQKARFQLFGDTMNTASRMESNGVKGRIQVSEETAHELRLLGKSSWLVPREDKIVAKGKGELQTYFVYPPSPSTAISSSNTARDEVEDGQGNEIAGRLGDLSVGGGCHDWDASASECRV